AGHASGRRRANLDGLGAEPLQPTRPVLAAADPPDLLSPRLSVLPGPAVRPDGDVRDGAVGTGGDRGAPGPGRRPRRRARLLSARRSVGSGGHGAVSRARVVLRALLVGDAVHGPALVGDRAAAGRGRLGVALGAGGLWGLAILTRETVLYFVPLAALWLATRAAAGARLRAGAFLVAALIVVAPWTYRNWLEFHAFVPVSTAGGQNLFQGNALIERDVTYQMVDAVQGRVAQYHYAMRMGLAAIRDRQPWWIFEKLRDEMPRFWEADSLVLVHIKRGAYGPVAPALALAVALVVLAP